jgi:Tfp pilus assembly protein PilN
MPSINLIAARREEKRRIEQHIRRLCYIVMFEIGVIVLVASVMVAQIVSVHGRIAQLDGQIGLMQVKVNEIQSLQQGTAALKPKVAILNEARNNTLYWYTALQTVASCLPNQAWLTSVGTSGDPSTGATPDKDTSSKTSSTTATPTGPPPALTIAGQAANSDDVGLTMLKMNQFANISGVTLNSVTQGSSNGANTMIFSMAVQLKPNTATDADTPSDGPGQASPTVQPAAAIPNTATKSPFRQAAGGYRALEETNHA